MKILGIHGIGQTYLGATMLKQHWSPALIDGLSAGGYVTPLVDSDFEMVSYGQLFRPSAVRTATDPVIDPKDLTSDEQDLLVAWWAEAARLSAESTGDDRSEARIIQRPDFQGRGRTPQIVQRALRQLSKSYFFRGLGLDHAVLLAVRQVRLFLHDAKFKQSILDCVTKYVREEPRVIVAHSLGSVVAYEALCLNLGWKVDTLVTIGSPLGIRSLVFDALTPKPTGDKGQWPFVRQWINVADRGDIVAIEKSLAPRFGKVTDVLVYNGWKSHDATRYLTSKEVGAAIASGL